MPQLPKFTLLTSMLVPLGSFKVYLDAKERMGCGKQWEATSPIDPGKTAALVPEFAMEDLPLGRTAGMVPGFGVKDLPLGRTL